MIRPHQALIEGPDLASERGFSSLASAWFSDGLADADWRRALDTAPSDRIAPAWAHAEWREGWWRDFAADLPNEAARQRVRGRVDELSRGRAETIVTGQQPGFLGGPLYSLFKAAACVAAAEARTAAGAPTVPVFWQADDDDDLREAFDVRVWDPRRRALLRPRAPEAEPATTVGGLAAETVARAELAWLRERADAVPAAGRLAAIWARGLDEGLDWGRLHRRVLADLFARHGLLVVSGDDARLHAAASPLYTRLLADHERLADLARRRGDELETQGHHAQIGETSLSRPFGVADGRRRLRLAAGEAPPDDPSRLRPGVLLRAPVQDWLFRPAGVVVGPGEYAYLRQLEPLYEALGLTRAPMLPRLFGRLAPRGYEADRDEASDGRISARLTGLDESAERALRETITDLFGDLDSRAEALVRAHIVNSAERNADLFARLSAASGRSERPPAWLEPEGDDQERRLASYAALGVWGGELLDHVMDAAARHFESGLAGRWRRWIVSVDDPAGKGTLS